MEGNKENEDLLKVSEGKDSNSLPEQETVAWDGNLDAKLLRGRVKSEPLFAALQNRARQLGHSLQEMCSAMNFSYPYYAQLRSGMRNLSGGNEQFTTACAQYLGIPRLTVLGLADIVTPTDFVTRPNDLLARLPAAVEYIFSDPVWSHLVTANVRTCSPDVQYLIVRMYEKMTGMTLLPQSVDPEKLAEAMTKLRDIRDGVLDDWDD